MSALFLSHSAQDKAAAERLGAGLLGLGFTEVFIDNHSIQPGQKWEQVLYEKLRACRAVVVLLSPRFLDSKWCFAEVTHARSLGRPILPVCLEACNVPAFLLEYQIQDYADLSSAVLERLREGLSRVDVRPSDRPAWDRRRAPYPGLASFEVEDAGVYFGRDRDIQAGLDRLHDMALLGGDTALLILGASGTGKSSLLRAGLTDKLLRRPQQWCVVGPMRPLEAPFTQLIRTLHLARSRSGSSPWDEAGVRDALKDESAPLRAVQELRPSHHPDARFVLVVDQLEELLIANEGERKEFLTWLARVLALPKRPLLLLGSLRSDHLADFERMAPFAVPGGGYLSLRPIPIEGLRRSISQPAEVAGVVFEDGLADKILEDVRERQALPLLAFTLRELWDRRVPGERFTHHSYTHDIGGVQGAIRRAAQAASGGGRRNSHWRQLRRVLLRMVQVEADGRLLRHRMRMSEVPTQVHDQVTALVRARLLVVDDVFVEPAHEALFSSWEEIHFAVTEARAALIVRTELEADAARWLREGRSPEYLWPQIRLERAKELLQSAELELDSTGKPFAEASWDKVREEEKVETRRKQRETCILRAVAVGLVVLLAVISTLGIRAYKQQQLAQSREFTTSALLNVREDPQRALLLLRESVRRRAPERFREVMDAWGREQCLLVLRGHNSSGISTASFSRDGTRIVIASSDPTARVWDAATGRLRTTLEGHKEWVNTASFSPDGTRIVTGADDTTARVWDAATGKLLATLEGHTKSVEGADFSPDGTRVLTTSTDHTARLWDATTGKLLATVEGHPEGSVAASFSSDSSPLVLVSADNTARVWDATQGKPPTTLEGHIERVKAASFSLDGTRVVIASGNNKPRVWDAATGRLLATLEGHTEEVNAVSFSPDGTRIVTGADDKTARVWVAATGKFLATLEGHTHRVDAASFSPDGTRIVTSSVDETARLWDAATGKPLTTLAGHTHRVEAAAFSPDGTRIVTSSADDTARVWDAAPGKPLTTLEGHTERVNAASFSPDGTRIVTASGDNMARVWDAATGRLLATLEGHTEGVNAVSFSPDGTQIVTGSDDKTARVWDVATGNLLFILEGHTNLVGAVSFSPDGTHIVTASEDDSARVWEAKTGKLKIALNGHLDWVVAASFSPDGTHIVTASADNTARVWDAATGGLRATLKGHTERVVAASFLSGGTRIVTASWDSTARVWDAATSQPLTTLKVRPEVGFSASFSPDATRLVTASDDETAHVWDMATGKLLATLEGHTDLVIAASFSSDSTRIVTTSYDRTARVWPSWRWDAEAFSHMNIGRDFTCEERRDFLHEQIECRRATPEP